MSRKVSQVSPANGKLSSRKPYNVLSIQSRKEFP